MKKNSVKLLILLVGSLASFAFLASTQSPDIEKINHRHYLSYFSKSEHIPIVLTYTLTSDMLQCGTKIPRKGIRFATDPDYKDVTALSKDYRGSGFDKGHNMSAADNSCEEEGMKECFYFSNMTPQPHSFNAGRWEDLEKIERAEAAQYDKIIVTVGSLGVSQKIGDDNVVVPREMWKVIYIPKTSEYQCYLFPNTDNVTMPIDSYKVEEQEIEDDADVTFNDGKVTVPEQ
jgi:endonuclease G